MMGKLEISDWNKKYLKYEAILKRGTRSVSIYNNLAAKEKFFFEMKMHFEVTHKKRCNFFYVIGFILYLIILCVPIYANDISIKLLLSKILIVNLMFIPLLILILIISQFVLPIITSKTIDKYGYEFKKLKHIWVPVFYLKMLIDIWTAICKILVFVFVIYFLKLGSGNVFN